LKVFYILNFLNIFIYKKVGEFRRR